MARGTNAAAWLCLPEICLGIVLYPIPRHFGGKSSLGLGSTSCSYFRVQGPMKGGESVEGQGQILGNVACRLENGSVECRCYIL